MKRNIPSMAITFAMSGILMTSYGEKTKQDAENVKEDIEERNKHLKIKKRINKLKHDFEREFKHDIDQMKKV